MKNLVFVAITFAIVVIAWQLSERNAPQTEVVRGSLLPGLLERMNDISQVNLESKKHRTELVRVGDSWQLANKDNFPANGADVKRSLLQLASLRTIEAKTDNPERYAKLGVEDLDQADAPGTTIEVVDGQQSSLVSLILGNSREAATAKQQYVRQRNEAQAWLVEGELELPTDPIKWLDASIADIDTKRVREVRIATVDDQPIVITKAELNDNFYALQNVPAGYVAKSKAIISSIAAILLDLRFNDVATVSRIDGVESNRQVTVKTFDGLITTLDEFVVDETAYARFAFRYDEAAVSDDAKASPETDDAAASDLTTTDSENDVASSEAVESVADEAARLSAQTAEWIYVLPNYKRRMINRTFDSLIKEPEPETEPEAG